MPGTRRTLTMRAVAFASVFAMFAWLLPANWADANATAEKATNLSNPRVASNGTVTWDCVYFGNYPQSSDGHGGYKEEPIKWRVLSVNGEEAFLLADKNLDCEPYNKEQVAVTWEDCSLRSWLNGYDGTRNACGIDCSSDNFINAAFNASERNAIIDTVAADKISLLSSTEEAMEKTCGFETNGNAYDLARRAKNTDYAKKQGAWTDTSNRYRGNGAWWLRSPKAATNVLHVRSYGNLCNIRINKEDLAVRPALHLDLSSVAWSYAGTVVNNELGSKFSYNGNEYQLYDLGRVPYEKAEEFCEERGGHLATITSQKENDEVYRYMVSAGYASAYFGLKETGKNNWEWVNGEPVSFLNWGDDGEPNNVGGNENWGMFYWKYKNRKWNDGAFCNGQTDNDTTVFICEWDEAGPSTGDTTPSRYPVMEEQDAKAFWAFLFNVPQDFRTKEFFETDILEDPIFKLLTGKYAPCSEEETVARNVFAAVVDGQLSKLTADGAKATGYLRKTLLECMEKELGDDPDAAGMNGECQKIFDKIRTPLQEKLLGTLMGVAANACGKQLTQATIDNITLSMNMGTEIAALPGKIDEFVNRSVMGVSGALLTIQSEVAGRYQYFKGYLDNRGLADDPNDLIVETLSAFAKFVSKDGNLEGIFTTLIPGKSTWMECTDTIDRWAENTYLILNDKNAGADKEPVEEPSKPNAEPGAGPNVVSNTEPGTGLSTGSGAEPNVKPSTGPASRTDTPSGIETDAKHASKQTITVKSYTKTDGDKGFNLGAKAKTALAYQSNNEDVATINATGFVTIKGPGQATITIKAIATKQYKAATKKITITVKPKRPVLGKASSSKKACLKLTWKYDKKASGYQAAVATDKKFKKNRKTATIKKNKTTKKTFKKLKRKKVYYAKVRAYKKVGQKKVYGAYSKVKKARVK